MSTPTPIEIMEQALEAAVRHGPKFPHITVQLVGQDGNAFNLLGIMQRALRKAKVSEDDQAEFMLEAMSGDYDHLLVTCMQWVNVT